MKVRASSFTGGSALTPFLAIILALACGALIIWVSGYDVVDAYRGLARGAFGSKNNWAETLVATSPYILAGLAVAFAFQCGLFNIGGGGQLIMGAITSTWVGYHGTGLPMAIHLPLTILAGAAGGAAWAALAGWLKASFGAHEVITTIMLNYVAAYLLDFLVNGPMHGASAIPKTPDIAVTARLPILLSDTRLHAGIIIALIMVGIIHVLLYKTTLGLSIRLVGANPTAAENAGLPQSRYILTAMMISGALAGLAGTFEIIGVNYALPTPFNSEYGFDAIAIALLGRSTPLGVLLAAFLFGAMRNGASTMQIAAMVPSNIISMIQAFVIFFLSAEILFGWIWKRKAVVPPVATAGG